MDVRFVLRMMKDTMTGKLSMNNDEAELLFDTLHPGDVYVETGTFFGGSAILAAHKAERVYTIDNMIGDYFVQNGVQARDILDNFAKMQVAHKISLIKAKSFPWPLPEEIKPDVFLIDGGHSYQCAALDWTTADLITKRAILVHDYNRKQYPGVMRMVEEIDWMKWEQTRTAGAMARYERC